MKIMLCHQLKVYVFRQFSIYSKFTNSAYENKNWKTNTFFFFWYGCWIWMTSVYVVCSNFICTNIKVTSSTMSMTILPGLKIIQIDKVLVIWDIDALLNDLEGLIWLSKNFIMLVYTIYLLV